MALVPEDAFRELLAARDDDEFAAFVADLWRARGHAVDRDGDRLHVDDGTLVVAPSVAAAAGDEGPSGSDARLVVARPPPADAPGDVVGPADLRGVLLYGVERQRAADLFASHFGRPLDGDWSGWRGRLGGSDDEPGEDAGGGGDPTAVGRLAAGVAAAPTGSGELRALAGDRRVRAVALAVLVTVAATSWALFVHRPDVGSTREEPFAMPPGEPPASGSYRVVASAEWHLDGRGFYFERVHTYVPENGTVVLDRWTYSTVDGGRTTVEYRRGDTVYTRTSLTNGTRYRAVQPSRVPVAGATVVDATRTIYETEPAGPGLGGVVPPGLATVLLAALPYERAGTTTYEGREVVRYRPTAGWMVPYYRRRADPAQFRVRHAEGTLLVDRTGTLLYADVTATTVRGNTWGEVLSGEARTLTVRYRTEVGVDRPTVPPWVAGLRDGTANVTG